MVTIHLTPATGNPGFQTGWRTAAAERWESGEGKGEGRTITGGETGHSAP